MPRVFISHQQKDSEIAEYIADLLYLEDIDYFLDVYDPYKGTNAKPLDIYIIDVLGSCSHLLTILSNNTNESWWVPFEIGIATEKDIPIANFFHEIIKVPEYLMNWPYLQDDKDLKHYFKLIKKEKRRLIFENKVAGFEPRYSEAFHKELKKELGQY